MKSSPYPPRQPPIYPYFYKKILISPMTFENSQPPISNGSSHYGSRHFNLCPPGNLTYNPPDSYHHPTRQREINSSQVEVFWKNLSPAERGRVGNYKVCSIKCLFFNLCPRVVTAMKINLC